MEARMKDGHLIRAATFEDAEAIARIYNWYIEHTAITFEESLIDAAVMRERICIEDATRLWLVLEIDNVVQRYACAARWKDRSAYRFFREVSIYLDQSAIGHGHGKRLLAALLDVLRETPIHLLIAGISLPNDASIGLHEAFGFEPVGDFSEVGFKFNEYLDVGYWQLKL